MFPETVTNDLGHTTRAVHHPVFGVPVWVREANGRVTRSRYDGFGRLRESDGPGQADATTTYRVAMGLPLVVETTADTGAASRKGFDRLGREVLSASKSADGTFASVTTNFDDLGRVARVDRPYGYTSFEYDDLGRLRFERRPDDGLPQTELAEIETVYEDWLTTRTIEDVRDLGEARWKRQSSVVRDGLGQVVEKREDNEGQTVVTKYEYEPFALLARVRHGPVGTSSESVTSMAYDALGRRVTLTTPDTGTTGTEYSAFGEVRVETDAEGRRVEYTRDALGRVKRRTDTSSGGAVQATDWVYDVAPNGIGALAEATSPDGVRTVLAYEATFGLARTSHLYVPGQNGGNPFETIQEADNFGRIERITYPQTGTVGPRFVVRQTYNNQNGQPSTVLDASTANESLLWSAILREPLGRVETEMYGNAITSSRSFYPATGRLASLLTGPTADVNSQQAWTYEYDLAGQLRLRSDYTLGGEDGLHEGFDYDNLGRLTGWYRADATGASVQDWSVFWEYDDRGNMKKRRTKQGNATVQNITYTTGGAGYSPHQLASTSLWSGSFSYDRVGNVTSHPGVGTITYTPFNLPRRVTGSAGSGAATVDYLYDAFGGRVLKTVGGGSTISTTYVGGLYERRQDGSSVSHVLHVFAEGRVVAQVVRREGSAGSQVSYVYADHLGSTHVVQAQDGTMEVRRQDPFGNRVSVVGDDLDPKITAAPQPAALEALTRGFTGHEEEGDLGLVNMGGRIYDARVGRFLQADPFISNPFFGQSFHGYRVDAQDPHI
jgi:RHS repeat-associated protein